MSLKKNKKQESENEIKQHQDRGARGVSEDPAALSPGNQYQGEYHEEGQPVRGNTSPEGKDAPGASKTKMAHEGKGGIGQNNLGQHADRDDDFQSGSKGGNRSGKTGSKQGGSRGKGTM